MRLLCARASFFYIYSKFINRIILYGLVQQRTHWFAVILSCLLMCACSFFLPRAFSLFLALRFGICLCFVFVFMYFIWLLLLLPPQSSSVLFVAVDSIYSNVTTTSLSISVFLSLSRFTKICVSCTPLFSRIHTVYVYCYVYLFVYRRFFCITFSFSPLPIFNLLRGFCYFRRFRVYIFVCVFFHYYYSSFLFLSTYI